MHEAESKSEFVTPCASLVSLLFLLRSICARAGFCVS